MQNVIKITLIRRLFPEQTKPIQHLPFHKNLRLQLLKKQTYIRRNYRISYEKLSIGNSLKKKKWKILKEFSKGFYCLIRKCILPGCEPRLKKQTDRLEVVGIRKVCLAV